MEWKTCALSYEQKTELINFMEKNKILFGYFVWHSFCLLTFFSLSLYLSFSLPSVSLSACIFPPSLFVFLFLSLYLLLWFDVCLTISLSFSHNLYLYVCSLCVFRYFFVYLSFSVCLFSFALYVCVSLSICSSLSLSCFDSHVAFALSFQGTKLTQNDLRWL